MREFSVPAMVEVPDSATLTDAPFTRAAKEPGAIVARRRSGDAWSAVTAAEFTEEITAVAKGLVAAGIEPGDRVCLLSRTRYEWTVLDYAVWTAGGVSVPIYETSSAEQIEWIVGDSGAKAVFAETADHIARVEEVRERLPELAHLWGIDAGGIDEVRKLGAETGDDVVEERRGSCGAGDLATLVYTSGTTGRPKGCEITHGNLVSTSRNAVQGAIAEVAVEGSSTLLFLPLAHVFARLIQVATIEGGIVLGHSDIKNLLPDLGSFQPTFLLAVPRVFEKVYNGAEQKAAADGKGKIFKAAAETAIAYSRALDGGGPGIGLKAKHKVFDALVYKKLRAAVGGKVEYAVSGGAALGERLGHFFRGVGITILEGYGLTETTAPASVNRPTALRIGTVGQPIPGVDVRIAEDGEVLVRGINIMRGYWNNEAATKEVLEDGWLHTGDLGALDDDGFLRITGRKKEILVTAAGKNVAPAPLEDRLRSHPLVSQCLVVGDGRKFISALVTLDEEALGPWKAQHGKPEAMTVDELRRDPDVIAEIEGAIAEANKSVSRAESIKKHVILGVDFTEEAGHMTPSLKVKRNVVIREFADEIEALYTG
ncbi:AMP-dependent synthetase/ligase [Actinomadura livida]|uniref:Acyl-CoA synthetase n=1 Tax=Actinomadura livida TaxID=79909 RepID=A0A7W7IGW1_9ACTN|nr:MULTISPECIES: AMP-dependent synthetase/ligase [Actinomadura]MBB4776493.1 long-chain acyl-CoA synthetase [Actinomadura catellatispora]GGT92708.1 long-chain-fatty-acid--CoA ligase [Actinomadura livida]